MNFFTKVVAQEATATPANAVSPPIFQTSAFAFDDIDEVEGMLSGQQPGYFYTRSGNPNFDTLAELMASLEGTEAAVVTASGTASLMTAMLTLRPAPARLLISQEIYGGTVGIARRLLDPLGYRMQWVNLRDLGALAEAMAGSPALLMAESISNPLCRVSALDQVIELAHQHDVPVVVDNTFATPFHAQPAALGADLVVHSLSKYIGGHSDLILGVVAGSKSRIAEVRRVVSSGGFTPDPFSAWLALRGARTLALRMERSSQNALQLARALEHYPGVRGVSYPGLASHPDHRVATRLLNRGYGAIVPLAVEGGYVSSQRVVQRLKLVRFVPSLGDVATTVSHARVGSHRELTPEEQKLLGPDGSVVRISVGIDDVQDVLADFQQALDS